MSESKEINILAIESSCDETAAAVVRNGREVRSNIISSQIDLHKIIRWCCAGNCIKKAY